MPYIDQNTRKLLNSDLALPTTAGELNYQITKVIHGWLQCNGLNYNNINAAVGVLEFAKASLFGAVLVPYEKVKMKQNGNISKLDKDYYDKL